MQTLSAVIITKNEEKNIGRCLEAIADWVDEIIVVDSGSTDRTKEICLAVSKVKWFEQPWLGYGQQKNFANSLAKGDYILSLDADEVVSPELKADILARRPWQGVYRLNRITNYCGQWIHHCGWRPDYQWRLFSPKLARWNEKQVHEHLEFASGTPTATLNGDLFHYSYHTIRDHWVRILPYARLGAERAARKPSVLLALQAILNPPLRFIKCYLFQRGFLDGFYGLVICLLTAYGVYKKYALALELKAR
jgi:glycosyltransferase involved in cell wall biosynthesis